MVIRLTRIVRVSVLLFVSLILPLHKSLADDQGDNSTSPTSLQQNIDTCYANQDYTGAFACTVHAMANPATSEEGTAACLKSLTEHTPDSIDLSLLSVVPKDSLPFTIVQSKTEAGNPVSNDRTLLVIPDNALPTDQDDPVDDWPFSRAVYVYSAEPSNTASLLCTIHFQSNDCDDLAQRTGALLALLDKVYADRMGVSRADDSYPFHVWLCSTAPVSNGGEQWRNNIYFYDVSDPGRSSIEWIREIAHEFSHLAFAAVGGSYTDPEAFANGYMGERLLVRWLSEGTAGGKASVEAAWKGTFVGYYNFNQILIVPPLEEFNKYGLNKDKLAERDAEGMRYLVGMMLTVDDKFGSNTVGQVLQGLADQHSSDPNLLYAPIHQLLLEKSRKKD